MKRPTCLNVIADALPSNLVTYFIVRGTSSRHPNGKHLLQILTNHFKVQLVSDNTTLRQKDGQESQKGTWYVCTNCRRLRKVVDVLDWWSSFTDNLWTTSCTLYCTCSPASETSQQHYTSDGRKKNEKPGLEQLAGIPPPHQTTI